MPRRDRILIEVAIESVDDALAAEGGGADRLELCTALDLGGLTPSLGLYLEVRAAVRLPVVLMIRPRGGDFVYTAPEIRVMARDIETFLPHKPDGFVFGVLQPDGWVNADRSRWLVQSAGGAPCVFHRAFDRCPDVTAAVDELAGLGFARLLTSGREKTALAGAAGVAAVVKAARGRIEVLPCGSVRADSAPDVVRLTGCDQVHGSFAVALALPDGIGYRGYPQRYPTSRDEVAATREALDRLAER